MSAGRAPPRRAQRRSLPCPRCGSPRTTRDRRSSARPRARRTTAATRAASRSTTSSRTSRELMQNPSWARTLQGRRRPRAYWSAKPRRDSPAQTSQGEQRRRRRHVGCNPDGTVAWRPLCVVATRSCGRQPASSLAASFGIVRHPTATPLRVSGHGVHQPANPHEQSSIGCPIAARRAARHATPWRSPFAVRRARSPSSSVSQPGQHLTLRADIDGAGRAPLVFDLLRRARTASCASPSSAIRAASSRRGQTSR